MKTGDPTEMRILRAELLDAHRELARLRMQTEQLVASNRDLSGLLGASAQRLGQLLKEVVAFQQLLDARDIPTAWRSLEDILVNVVGTEDFVILQVTDTDGLLAVAGRGPAFERAVDAAPTLDVALDGVARAVHLHIGERVVAVIAINTLLPHRHALDETDEHVLSLISRFAASAVMMAEQQKSWVRLTPRSAW